jgi:hypothetical protein
MSGKSGCQENLDVSKIGMSAKSGCQENLDVRNIRIRPGMQTLWGPQSLIIEGRFQPLNDGVVALHRSRLQRAAVISSSGVDVGVRLEQPLNDRVVAFNSRHPGAQ